jgi:hypothetical protein
VTPRALLTQLNTGRIVIGAVLIAKPELVTGPWLGKDGGRPAVQVLARGFGARDAALGAGTLAALRGGGSIRTWVLAGLLADAADLLGTCAGRDHLPKPSAPLIYVLAGGALLVGAANLADSPPPQA